MRRRPLSRLARVRIFDGTEGRCHLCGLTIVVGERWEVEHCKPLWLGGADDESNMAPAHVHCHAAKSAGEKTIKAKGDRIRARHLGIKPDRTIRVWRKFDGTIVRK